MAYNLLRFALFKKKTIRGEGNASLLLLKEDGEGYKSKQAKR
jgi:hypothetical protein